MPDDPIHRIEYQEDMRRLEQEIKDLRTDMAQAVKELSTGVNTLSLTLQRGRVTAWQFIAVSSLNFILSGGFITIILAIGGHFK